VFTFISLDSRGFIAAVDVVASMVVKRLYKTAEMRRKQADDCKQVISPCRQHRLPQAALLDVHVVRVQVHQHVGLVHLGVAVDTS
jgi:hypothetical protein